MSSFERPSAMSAELDTAVVAAAAVVDVDVASMLRLRSKGERKLLNRVCGRCERTTGGGGATAGVIATETEDGGDSTISTKCRSKFENLRGARKSKKKKKNQKNQLYRIAIQRQLEFQACQNESPTSRSQHDSPPRAARTCAHHDFCASDLRHIGLKKNIHFHPLTITITILIRFALFRHILCEQHGDGCRLIRGAHRCCLKYKCAQFLPITILIANENRRLRLSASKLAKHSRRHSVQVAQIDALLSASQRFILHKGRQSFHKQNIVQIDLYRS
jgi:hypothetical protein